MQLNIIKTNSPLFRCVAFIFYLDALTRLNSLLSRILQLQQGINILISLLIFQLIITLQIMILGIFMIS